MHKPLAAIIAVMLPWLSGCERVKQASVRYKVTVAINDHGALRYGSAIWQLAIAQAAIPLASSYSVKFTGEAIPVELANGTAMFVLLRGPRDESAPMMLPERLFGDLGRRLRGVAPRFGTDRVADIANISRQTGRQHILDCHEHPEWCPMLVAFDDLQDPTSVRLGNPADVAPHENPSVALQSVLVEITHEAPTWQLDRLLPWLSSHRGALAKNIYKLPLNTLSVAYRLHDGDFRQGGVQ